MAEEDRLTGRSLARNVKLASSGQLEKRRATLRRVGPEMAKRNRDLGGLDASGGRRKRLKRPRHFSGCAVASTPSPFPAKVNAGVL